MNYLFSGIVVLIFCSMLSGCEDKISPDIELSGKTQVKIPLNSEYVEPGYSAEDNEEGDITDQVSITDSVNVNQAGTYTITYTVDDPDGNMATVTRKVIVYNQADFLESGYKGNVVYPYPGSEPKNYYDSIIPSDTANYRFALKNFANTGEKVTGQVIPQIENVYWLVFEDQGNFASIDTVEVSGSPYRIFFEYQYNNQAGQSHITRK